MQCYRRFDTRAQLSLSYWTVDGGLVYLARKTWDPQGPMSARQALRAALIEALKVLEPPAPSQGFEDVPLPFEGEGNGSVTG